MIYYLNNGIKIVQPGEVDFSLKGYYWFSLKPEEVELLNSRLFDFNYSTIDECKSKSQIAKLDFFDEYTFMVFNSLKYESGVVSSDEFNVFLGKKYIITVSRDYPKILIELGKEVENYSCSVFFSKDLTPSKILYFILDRLVLHNFEIINKLEFVADSLEIHIMKKPNKQFLQALLHLRHQVHTLRRCVAPLRYIGDNLMSNENGIIEKEYLKILQRINNKIDKLIFSMESLIQYIVLVREAFEVEVSNKTNELMKLFTIIAMFFSPLTLITGIYGMNFRIPEYGWKYGYLYSLGLMLIVIIGLFIYFKRKKWL
jgi:magnesium transporter